MADEGYTSKKAQDALDAATALAVGAKPGFKKGWVRLERYWARQLEYAKKAGR